MAGLLDIFGTGGADTMGLLGMSPADDQHGCGQPACCDCGQGCAVDGGDSRAAVRFSDGAGDCKNRRSFSVLKVVGSLPCLPRRVKEGRVVLDQESVSCGV